MRQWIPSAPSLLWITALSATAVSPMVAQDAQSTAAAVTAEDYRRAESFLAANTSKLVSGLITQARWLPDDRIIYRTNIDGGHEFIIADPASRTRSRAFDHSSIAAAFSEITGDAYEPKDLPFRTSQFSDDGSEVSLSIDGKRFRCDLVDSQCSEEESSSPPNSITSPDGQWAAFIRDHNLWVRELETGEDTQLTEDGVQDFGYGTNNAGWLRSDRPVLKWSPDSKKIATFQHDGLGVGEMYLVSTEVGHPKLEAWKYPLPGDTKIFMLHRVVIHLDGPRVVRMQMPPDAHRSTTTDHVASRSGEFLDVQWSDDSKDLAFVSSSRDHRRATLRMTDPETGSVRDVFEESTETFYESGSGQANWLVLEESNEAIWFSRQDNWGHLYLHDLLTGELKHQITKGPWNVLQLRRIDAEDRTLTFTASGLEEGNPYYHHLYRINMDGTGLERLTPEPGHHVVSLSPSGKYFLDDYSTPTTPPVTVLRTKKGEVQLELEKTDISRLEASGWQPPTQFQVKARDGETDLYGLMYKPTQFDPSRKYPVLNYLYPGPQSGSVGSRAFRPSRSDKQSLAELGFIVVEVDAMGTPGRSKSFHDVYYGNMGTTGSPIK